ncbi:MAG: thiamine diphosphokinase [Eubacterium sp.]|nr:thiamine diphosphokinase [Eubacterium sp.]
MDICYIFGGGERSECNITFNPGDLVIAADAGFDYLKDLGLRADVVLGDFDSVMSYDLPSDCLRYPREKDDTDMMLAAKLGLEKGYREFRIYGGLGGRLDHTLGNIQVLTYLADHDASGILWANDHAIEVVKDGTISFSKDLAENRPDNIISIFSLSEVSVDVTIKGLKYEVENVNLTHDFPLGISNEFTGNKAYVNVKKGTIAVLWYLID